MTTRIAEMVPTPEILLALTREEIGMLLLEYLKSLPEMERGSFYASNVLQARLVSEYPLDRHEEALEALRTGWQWLVNESLLVPQPGPTVGPGGWMVISKRGAASSFPIDLTALRAAHLLPREPLHRLLPQAVRDAFLRGDYDNAVLLAFKQVEIEVRGVGGFSNSDYGVRLMRTAFDPTNGVLTDRSAEGGERQGRMDLFTGAIGCYKNPGSHRLVKFDPHETVELLRLASHLLRIVDTRRSFVGVI